MINAELATGLLRAWRVIAALMLFVALWELYSDFFSSS
jgi:hypothetical protein